jgi:hypothetical protein
LELAGLDQGDEAKRGFAGWAYGVNLEGPAEELAPGDVGA